jgi:hypothetical protein
MNDENSWNLLEKNLKLLRVIHYSIMAFVIAFTLTMIGIIRLRGNFMTPDYQMTSFYFMVCTIFMIAGIALGNLTFHLKMSSLKGALPVKNKLMAYQGAHISRITLLTIPALFAVISYILTSNNYFFIIEAIMLGLLFWVLPNKNTVLRTLKIKEEDMMTSKRTDSNIVL